MSPPIRLALLAAIPALMIVACNRESAERPDANQGMSSAVPAGPAATVALVKADGSPAGSVAVEDSPNGVSVAITATGLMPGTHGVHLHAVGTCEGPKFESAGSHWNPTQRKHGRDNPEGAHMGDLANLDVRADGSGAATAPIASTRNALTDGDGTSLVIHAKADDYKTDPSGNSGDRIACAVISPAK